MKIAFFNAKQYDQQYFDRANAAGKHQINYFSAHLNVQSTSLISNEEVVCAFINDHLDAQVLSQLKQKGVKLVALRSAGFNHVDSLCAQQLDLPVVRVPAYSPYAVAEHTVALLLCLNRGIHRANNRVREGDFSLRDLIGFDLHGKTIGIIGTGNIGKALINIMLGFGCQVIAYDPKQDPACIQAGVSYVSLQQLFSQAQIISLHCPLTPQTHHLINQQTLAAMRDGVTIINTSRGKLIDTQAIIKALKSKKVGLLGLDVYEEEEELFFDDFSAQGIQDDQLARLTTFPNVIITSHQAFFTHEAMSKIAQTTLENINQFETQGSIVNGIY